MWLRICADGVRRFREISTRSILLGAVCLSTGIVAMHVPYRWNGGRTGEVANVPLRPLSAIEAAALLKGGPDGVPVARVTNLTEKTAVVSTRVYPLVSSVDLDECWPGGRHSGLDYQFCSSSWADYHNVHRVARTELERHLGRSLSAADLQPSVPGYSLVGSQPSFASDRLAAYFISEVMFLTALLTGVALALRRVPSALLAPPIFTAAAVTSAIFVFVYSPALFDADDFYQRIAIEEVLGGRGPLGFAFRLIWVLMPALTVVCLPVYAALRIRQLVRRRRAVAS